jgi:methyl-accepting chemotaxis protein
LSLRFILAVAFALAAAIPMLPMAYFAIGGLSSALDDPAATAVERSMNLMNPSLEDVSEQLVTAMQDVSNSTNETASPANQLAASAREVEQDASNLKRGISGSRTMRPL